ncbi:uncharacterized protein CLUP02_11865 [Colletotrichum lupini]|uniref:DUF6546 domain-containing protein n=1 Tax=Colletotrichum lupini TaxID=145971 RepID=A0A9Q8T072_9PEZI|nr:uncharacterized protein CLUP02_11865 [Colletotrichum lupini]UQC86365.1 hypothetical protein CLUP02_11865 [Colletotrichum lupini]
MNTLKSEAQWSDLPQEIRGKILEYVPGRFAGICRDWQNAIEPRNFRVLQVGSDDQSLGNLAKTLHNNINLEISASSPNDVGNSCGIEGLLDYWQQQQRYVFAPISLGDFSLPYVNCVTGLSIDACSRKKPELINTLLSQDGRVAKKMPALRVMELYGAWRESAGVFRYLVTGNSADITWVSTLEFKLGDEPKYIWWDVAQLREDRLVLQFAPERHLRIYDGPSHFVHRWLVTRGLALHSSSSAALGHHDLPDPLRRISGFRDVS